MTTGNNWRWCNVCGAGYVADQGHPCVVESIAKAQSKSRLEYKPPILRELSAPETLTKLLDVLTPADRLKVFDNFCHRCGLKRNDTPHMCIEADPFR